MLWSAGCSLLRAEGFSCSLDIFYSGLEIFDQKNIIFFSVEFLIFLGVIKTLDLDPEVYTDPKHCLWRKF